MFGLMILLVVVVYLLISIAVVKLAIRYARKHGRSAKRLGWGAALVMYLIPFWDWLPTVITHQYYCATESGFWVYKTLDQWDQENPGVIETLVVNKGEPSSRQGNMTNYIDTYFVNQRINWIVKRNGKFPFNRWRYERQLVDRKNNEVLARYVDFSTSQEPRQAGWSGWKIWLDTEHCIGGISRATDSANYFKRFKGEEK